MHVTNVHGLSDSWVSASADYYKQVGFRSATGLVQPPRITQLQKRHDDKIVVDVVDRIWALLGNSVHYILEKSGSVNALVEQRYTIQVLGKVVSLKPDRAERIPNTDPPEYHLKDYKVTSVYTVKKAIEYGKEDWEQQTNIYGYGLRQNGINVTKITIEALMRDWNKTEMLKTRGYPEVQVKALPITVWDDLKCQRYLERRVELHVEAETLADHDLPFCTHAERWADNDLFAVRKVGAARCVNHGKKKTKAEAVMLCAERNKNTKGLKYEIEFRKSKSKRCTGNYCNVREFCNQYNCVINPPF